MPKSRIPALIFSIGFLFVLLGIVLFRVERHSEPLPRLKQVEAFSLIDSDNRKFESSTELKGKVWVAQFFFTTCSGICPIITGHMASLYRSYVLDPRVHFISITVNPDNDTPEVLTKYSERFKVDTRRWHFLTGSITAIQDVGVNKLKVGNTEEPVFHSPYFVLVDDKGWIRGYYDGLDKKAVKKLFKDIAQVTKETK